MSSFNKTIILFAHGARDIRWREPFDALRATVQTKTNVPVHLAFLELMEPSLVDVITEVVQAGAEAVQIVPLFLGQGGHLRRDLPILIEKARLMYPGVSFTCLPPVGEAAIVQAAMAEYCVSGL